MAVGRPLNSQIRVLTAKLETTLGTAETLTNAEAGFRVRDRQMKIFQGVEEVEAQGTLGQTTGVPSDSHSELTFSMWAHGKGATGLPAWASVFLPSCCMPVTSLTYALAASTADWKTITAGSYINGRRMLGRGMMGTCVMSASAGKPLDLKFSYKGGVDAIPETDTAILTGMSYTAGNPPLMGGASTVTLASSTDFVVNSFELDLGIDVQLREDANSPGGYLCGWASNVKPMIKLDPEATLFATKDWYALRRAATTNAIVIVLNGGANNTITITAGTCQPVEVDDADRGGKLVDALGFRVLNNSLSIAFS
jgi:hypothetical protein